MAICAAEIAAGLLALAGPSVIGTFATSATAAASGTVFAAAWLGVTALGAVASWLLIDEAIARYALDWSRTICIVMGGPITGSGECAEAIHRNASSGPRSPLWSKWWWVMNAAFTWSTNRPAADIWRSRPSPVSTM